MPPPLQIPWHPLRTHSENVRFLTYTIGDLCGLSEGKMYAPSAAAHENRNDSYDRIDGHTTVRVTNAVVNPLFLTTAKLSPRLSSRKGKVRRLLS